MIITLASNFNYVYILVINMQIKLWIVIGKENVFIAFFLPQLKLVRKNKISIIRVYQVI